MLRTICLILFLFCIPHLALAQSSTALAEAMIAKGSNIAAINILKKEVKKHPADYQAWFMLGVTQAKRRQFHDAVLAFNKVVELQPSLAEPHNNLAVIYNETGNYRAAVNELEISLTLKPDYVTAQENIADLYIKLAADAYRKVLAKKKSPILQQRYQRLLNVRSGVPIESAAPKVDKKPVIIASTSNSPVQSEKSEAVVQEASADLSQSKQEVVKAIESWRIAWSNRDMVAYFSAYSSEFQYGEKYVSYAKWKDYKIWAMRKRSFIKIDIEDVAMSALAENVMKVELLQHFRSDSLNIDNRKEMLFRKSDAGWKIIYEASF